MAPSSSQDKVVIHHGGWRCFNNCHNKTFRVGQSTQVAIRRRKRRTTTKLGATKPAGLALVIFYNIYMYEVCAGFKWPKKKCFSFLQSHSQTRIHGATVRDGFLNCNGCDVHNSTVTAPACFKEGLSGTIEL